MRLALFFISFFFMFSGFSTTWDEPWRKEIIKNADHFVLAQVASCSDTLMTINVEKTLGGEATGTIRIDDFYMLHLCSVSGGHGPELHFTEGKRYYFLLKKGANGNYQLPTPTSGFDAVLEDSVNQVVATFRHSYHQAQVNQDIYEKIYGQLWLGLHGQTYDEAFVKRYVFAQLDLKPAGWDPNKTAQFFNQHMALETAAMLGISIDFDRLKPFAEGENFHEQVSALRAMGHVPKEDQSRTSEYLLKYIKYNLDASDFSKVIAIWSLWEIGDKKAQKQLWKMKDELSEESTGFGGNIMDPRVCTRFPSPKNAVIELKESNQ